MTTIATLGPAGTFSEMAAQRYIQDHPDLQGSSIRFYRSIKQAFLAIGPECERGVLPIENLSEGFVQVLLDLLLANNLELIHELYLPIRFSFVSNAANLADLKTVFVQFMAKGQCSSFLESLGAVEIVSTDSNIESLELTLEQGMTTGAVVPHHAIAQRSFPILFANIGDYPNNATRFVALAPQGQIQPPRPAGNSKTSLIILDDQDHPGLLVSLLASFSNRGINLRSIMSRPTGESIGKYHFFLDIEGHRDDEPVRAALEEVSQLNKVKVLGSYPAGRAF